MTVSGAFIGRPVATVLLAAGLLIGGLIAYARLPIAALPNVDRPTISVSASLPGASAETVASSLSQPLERQLGTIPGIVEMFSWSAAGGCEIDIQFDLGRSVDASATAVQAAINAAGPTLPKDLPQPPTYWKANPSGFAVIALALTSDKLEPSAVYDLADSILSARLASLPGVARVSISGADRSAVRIRAMPTQLARMGISLEQIRQTVRDATLNLPKGAVEDGEHVWTIEAADQLVKAAEYRRVVVAWKNGAAVHLEDVASVTDDVINDKLAGWFNDRRGVVIYVFKQLDANVVQTVDAVKATLPQLARWLPPTVHIHTIYDRTTLIRASITDVQLTIAIAVLLAGLVVAVFLRRLPATAIPMLTIPVTLGGTAIAMQACGYTVDNLSLMAVSISVGFIVDDAVIVVEDVMRRVEAGMTPRAAALASAGQIGFTIVAISAALVAALLPVLLMPDVVGRYFRQFGVTLAASIVISAVVSLTLTPMLCSRLLRAARHPASASGAPLSPSRPGRWQRLYARTLDRALAAPLAVVGVTLMALAASVWLYMALPKGFMPTQDTGILRMRTLTVANISFPAMEALQRTAVQIVLSDPAVRDVSSYIGAGNGSTLSAGNMVVALKPLEERRESIGQVIERLRQRFAGFNNVRAFFTPLQDLNIGAQSSVARYQYTLSGADPAEVARWESEMRRRMQQMPELTEVNGNLETTGLEAGLMIDRARAAAMGVTPLAVDNTLYDAFGQRQIRTIYLPSNFSRVILEVDPAIGTDPAALQSLYVPGTGDAQVPLAGLVRPFRAHAAMWAVHSDQLPSATISFDTRPGVAIASAITAIRGAERAARLPDEIRADFKGEAGEANKSALRLGLLFAAAIVAVYIVLGILYESYAHAFTILSTLPSAMLGALLALRIAGIDFTIIAAIACILLVGMVMKNAIMMVDFALALERAGHAPTSAIRLAAVQRARPIVMTTLIAVLTALPLALSVGPGHELRQPLGIASIGGLIMSQLLTLYSTPVLFLLVERLRSRRAVRSAMPMRSTAVEP